MLMPSLGVVQAYGGETAEYHNAFACYQLSKSLIQYSLRFGPTKNSSLECIEFLFSTCRSTNVSTYFCLNCFSDMLTFWRNVPNIVVYAALELCYIFNCTAHFLQADGRSDLAEAFTKLAGAFGFLSALAGFYLLAHGLCQDAIPFKIPLCETGGLLRQSSSVSGKSDEKVPFEDIC